MRVTWPATLPEGPGPTLYTVTYSTPSGTQHVPGCSASRPRPASTGTRLQRDRLHLPVGANNVANDLRPERAARPSRRSASRPRWGAWSVAADRGQPARCRSRRSLPDAAGQDAHGGDPGRRQVVWREHRRRGPGSSDVVIPPTTTRPPRPAADVQRVAPSGLHARRSSKTVQTYGPLNGMLNAHPAPATAAPARRSAGPSPAPATATRAWSSSAGQRRATPLVDPPRTRRGRLQLRHQRRTTADFDARTHLRVTVYDPAPRDRGSESGRATHARAPARPDGVASARRPDCNDDDGHRACQRALRRPGLHRASTLRAPAAPGSRVTTFGCTAPESGRSSTGGQCVTATRATSHQRRHSRRPLVLQPGHTCS